MENNIPIDKLFYNKLSQGAELQNLGAWANMSRMLEGENPYEKIDESKKKRRILPFLALFTLLTATISATYLMLTHQPSSKEEKHETVKHTTNPTTEKVKNVVTPFDNNTTTSNENIATSNSVEPQIKSIPPVNITINNSNEAEYEKNNITTSTQNETNKEANRKGIKNKQNRNTQLAINNTAKEAEKEEDKNEVIKNNTEKIVSEGVQSQKISKHEIVKDSIQLVEMKEKPIARNKRKQQPILATEFDTIASYKKEIIKDVVKEEVFSAPKKEVVNTRMVLLSPEEEINANKRVEITMVSASTSMVKNNTFNTIETETKKENSKPQESAFKQKWNDTKNKLANKRIDMYPGMSMGVNYALFNKSNNYGGFHFGLNNMIPISNYFSILSELKFSYKYNSGYTIKDVETSMKPNSYYTNTTMYANQNQTIHYYQIDSNTKRYNFNAFTTFELPIVLQAHVGKFMPYLGANFTYGSRLNTTTKYYNNSPTDSIILDNSTNFLSPNFKSYVYTKDDFKSRLGLGYSAGVSYNINSNIYIDIRVSQSVTDNAKTVASQEVSKGVFRIPFTQFSIGYRFKQYSNKN